MTNRAATCPKGEGRKNSSATASNRLASGLVDRHCPRPTRSIADQEFSVFTSENSAAASTTKQIRLPRGKLARTSPPSQSVSGLQVHSFSDTLGVNENRDSNRIWFDDVAVDISTWTDRNRKAADRFTLPLPLRWPLSGFPRVL